MGAPPQYTVGNRIRNAPTLRRLALETLLVALRELSNHAEKSVLTFTFSTLSAPRLTYPTELQR
jgi:hypothetical protein